MNDSDFKADIIQRTASQWAAMNPFLDKNDIGIESDAGRLKVGAGKRWSDTPYTPITYGYTGVVEIYDAEAAAYHQLVFTNGLLTSYTAP